MQKLYYNEQGWVCERYPYNFPIYDENLYIWVEDLTYEKTLQILFGKAWRVVDGKVVKQVYDKQDFQISETELERQSLKQELQRIKEDIEQVELFGMERSDYTQKKTRCIEIIERLRVLEQRLKEWSKEGK